MTIENEDVDLNNEGEEVLETKESKDEVTPAEEKESKQFETPEAKRARLTRQLNQLDKKFPTEKPREKQKASSDDLDYGQKAYLVANGIKEKDELKIVKDIMSETGRTLEQVLESKYFQAEIKELRDTKLTASAVPSTTKRTGQSAQDTVEYWIAKGELPEDRKLREQVVNRRIEKETKTDVFGS